MEKRLDLTVFDKVSSNCLRNTELLRIHNQRRIDVFTSQAERLMLIGLSLQIKSVMTGLLWVDQTLLENEREVIFVLNLHDHHAVVRSNKGW